MTYYYVDRCSDDCASAPMLKPCPFCGGEAKIAIMLGNYGIACTKCLGCIFPARKQTEEEAIEAWNRRVENA